MIAPSFIQIMKQDWFVVITNEMFFFSYVGKRDFLSFDLRPIDVVVIVCNHFGTRSRNLCTRMIATCSAHLAVERRKYFFLAEVVCVSLSIAS